MLSFSKILLIVAIIAVLFYGPRMFKKLKASMSELDKNKGSSSKETTDLTQCPDCGAYVAELSDHSCKNT